jgi:hypothetical protein
LISYRVLDVPPGGAGAFCPIPARNPIASSYGLTKITAMMGLVPIPSPKPAFPATLTGTRGGDHSANNSDRAPDFILRSQYVAYADNMGPAAPAGAAHVGMARRRMNELPVRAVDPGRRPIPVFQQFPAGARQLPWPRAFIRWPSRTGPNSGRQS